MSLVVLVLQNTALVLSLRYSRVSKEKDELFFTSTVVVLAEVLKLVTCLVIILVQVGSFQKYAAHMYEGIFVNWVDTVKMSVPAILFMVQTNLLFFAISYLEAAVYQVQHSVASIPRLQCCISSIYSNS